MSTTLRFLGFIMVIVLYFMLLNFVIGILISWCEGLPWYGVLLIIILFGIAVELAGILIVLVPTFIIGTTKSKILSVIFVCFALYYGISLLYQVWTSEKSLHWLEAILFTIILTRLFSMIILSGLILPPGSRIHELIRDKEKKRTLY